jgi:hypothetical protein
MMGWNRMEYWNIGIAGKESGKRKSERIWCLNSFGFTHSSIIPTFRYSRIDWGDVR